jgi:hypothetical protein
MGAHPEVVRGALRHTVLQPRQLLRGVRRVRGALELGEWELADLVAVLVVDIGVADHQHAVEEQHLQLHGLA